MKQSRKTKVPFRHSSFFLCTYVMITMTYERCIKDEIKKLISSKFDLFVFEFWFICFPVGQIHLSKICVFLSVHFSASSSQMQRELKTRKNMFYSSNDRRNNKWAENKFRKAIYEPNFLVHICVDGVIFLYVMAGHLGHRRQSSAQNRFVFFFFSPFIVIVFDESTSKCMPLSFHIKIPIFHCTHT